VEPRGGVWRRDEDKAGKWEGQWHGMDRRLDKIADGDRGDKCKS